MMDGPHREDWWQKLAIAHYAEVYRFAHHLVMSNADAEDITQETFLRARTTKRFPEQDGEKRWL
jgi:DNA-directed RNA polymerase specialized sigma24 family protein